MQIFVSLDRHSITVDFAELVFETNTCLRSRHSALHSPRQDLPLLSESKCFDEEKLSRLPMLPCMSRRDNSPTRVVLFPPLPSPSPPSLSLSLETGSRSSCKRLVEFCKEISEKLAQPGYLGERVASGTLQHRNGLLKNNN